MSLSYFNAVLGYALLLVIAAPSLLSKQLTWHFFYATIDNRLLAFAAILACYPFAQIISSFFLHAGAPQAITPAKRTSLSLISALGFLTMAFGFLHRDLALLVLGRCLCAFSNEPTGQLLPSTSAANPLLMGLAFVIGPAIASLLADSTVLVYFQSALPFFALSLLSLADLPLKTNAAPIPMALTLGEWFSWLSHNLRRFRGVLFFMFITTWYVFIHFLGAWLYRLHHFTEVKIGFVYALLGVCFIIVYSVRSVQRPALLLFLLAIAMGLLFVMPNPLALVSCSLVVGLLSASIWRNSDWFFESQGDEKQGAYLALTTCLMTLFAIVIGFSILSLSA